MAQSYGTQGGSHEQHVKAGEQSHKNTAGGTGGAGEHEKQVQDRGTGTQGGTHEQHVKAGQQSHKNA